MIYLYYDKNNKVKQKSRKISASEKTTKVKANANTHEQTKH